MTACLCLSAFLAVTLAPETTEIVIAPDAPKTVRFAAKEMKHFLDGVFAADVPVVSTPTTGRAPVYLGSNAWTRAAGIRTETLPRDAFRIVSDAKGVFIAGRDDPKTDPERALGSTVWMNLHERGTLFGVYEFLERYAGVRTYFPGELGEIVPKTPRLDVPAADVTVAPAMTEARRYAYFGEGAWFEGEKRDKTSTGRLRWLNMYRLRMSTDNIPFCHGLSQRGYLARFHKTHPEYFQLKADGTRNLDAKARMPGKLCFTSGVWEEIFKDSLSYLKGESPAVRGIVSPGGRCSWWYGFYDRRYVDLMPQDGMCRCTCPTCAAAYDRDDPGNYMDTLIWSKTAEMARRLKAECPQAIVTQMAYQPYRRVPDVDLPDNVAVMVAERGPWSVPYPAQMKAEVDEIAAWAKKLGHPVSVWTYPLKYADRVIPDIPDMAPWQWGAYFKAVAPYARGLYAESNTDRFLYKHLDYYVLAKICWDPTVDVDRLIGEYFRSMYGPAAAPMEKIFRSLQDRWTCGVLRSGIETMWGPSFSPAPKSVIWTQVYAPKTLAVYDRLFAEAANRTAAGSLERRRVELMKRELLEPLRTAATERWRHFAGIETCQYVLGSGKKMTLAPRAGEPTPSAPVKTEATARREGDELVVEIVCGEPRMREVASRPHERDNTGLGGEDMVELILACPSHPADLHIFQVSSAGAVTDMLYRRSQRPAKMDVAWNANLRAQVTRGEADWRIALRLPLAAFEGLGDRFRAEIIRHRRLRDAKPETYNWCPAAKRYDVWDDFGTWFFPKADLGVLPEASRGRTGVEEKKGK